jgi:hypothetical protein
MQSLYESSAYSDYLPVALPLHLSAAEVDMNTKSMAGNGAMEGGWSARGARLRSAAGIPRQLGSWGGLAGCGDPRRARR